MGGSRVRDFWESGGFFSSLVDSIVLGVTDMIWPGIQMKMTDDWIVRRIKTRKDGGAVLLVEFEPTYPNLSRLY